VVSIGFVFPELCIQEELPLTKDSSVVPVVFFDLPLLLKLVTHFLLTPPLLSCLFHAASAQAFSPVASFPPDLTFYLDKSLPPLNYPYLFLANFVSTLVTSHQRPHYHAESPMHTCQHTVSLFLWNLVILFKSQGPCFPAVLHGLLYVVILRIVFSALVLSCLLTVPPLPLPSPPPYMGHIDAPYRLRFPHPRDSPPPQSHPPFTFPQSFVPFNCGSPIPRPHPLPYNLPFLTSPTLPPPRPQLHR